MPLKDKEGKESYICPNIHEKYFDEVCQIFYTLNEHSCIESKVVTLFKERKIFFSAPWYIIMI